MRFERRRLRNFRGFCVVRKRFAQDPDAIACPSRARGTLDPGPCKVIGAREPGPEIDPEVTGSRSLRNFVGGVRRLARPDASRES